MKKDRAKRRASLWECPRRRIFLVVRVQKSSGIVIIHCNLYEDINMVVGAKILGVIRRIGARYGAGFVRQGAPPIQARQPKNKKRFCGAGFVRAGGSCRDRAAGNGSPDQYDCPAGPGLCPSLRL
jgi:hypothetical protein